MKLLLGLLSLFFALSIQGQVYVNQNATGLNNGTSWTDAYQNLDTAIAHSSNYDSIWVAKGVYIPGDSVDRTASFFINKSIYIYGGFEGIETQLSQRNIEANPTILSGEIGNTSAVTDNLCNVVTVGNHNSILDGFSITKAYCESHLLQFIGGSLTIKNGSIWIKNCTFYDNYAYEGGAIYVDSDFSVRITNSKFISNTADYGGAIYTVTSNITVLGCLFHNNTATYYGGVNYQYNSTSLFGNCTFVNNGSVVYSQLSGNCELRNSILVDNNNTTQVSNLLSGYYSISYCIIPPDQNYFNHYGAVYRLDTVHPTFYNELGVDGVLGTLDDDYSLTSCSSGRNKGRNEGYWTYTNLMYTDLKGDPRIFEDTLDLGAYEFYYTTRPPQPVISDKYVCDSGSVDLWPNSTGQFRWYSDTTQSPISYADTLMTPVLYATDTFYVSQVINCIESYRSRVIVEVKQSPVATITSLENYCDSAVIICYNGNPCYWYEDPSFSVVSHIDSAVIIYNPVMPDTIYSRNFDGYCYSLPTMDIIGAIIRDTAHICLGDSLFLYNRYVFSDSVYTDTLKSIHNCDSIILTTLIVDSTYLIAKPVINMCQYDSVLIFNNYQSQSGTYYDSLQSIAGCDSVIKQELIVYPTYYFQTPVVSICENDSILIFGNYQSIAGIYYDSLQTTSGCDSVFSQELIVYPTYFNQEPVTSICDNDSVLIFGTYQNTAGVYYDSLQTIYGCDSVISKELVVNTSYFYQESVITYCQGSTVYVYGTLVTGSGFYYDSLQTIHGCDSVYEQEVIMNTVDTSVTQNGITLTSNATNANYQWVTCNPYTSINGEYYQSFTPVQNGVYAVMVIQNFCMDYSSCYTINTVGIEENSNKQEFNVYPNPVNDVLNIQSAYYKFDYYLFNAVGELVHNKKNVRGYVEVDVKDLSEGVYYIHVITINGSFIQPVIVSR